MTTANELQARINSIEESYEFFLAYAAQGVAGGDAAAASGQARDFLDRMEQALESLADLFTTVVAHGAQDDLVKYQSFIDLLRQDAANSLAAVRMVSAQPAISSQMIDNLNALIHLRALLTDVFLIDEILNPRIPSPPKKEVDS